MQTNREVVSFNQGWKFHLGDRLAPEVYQYGNRGIISDETRVWQKAGNFSISKADNPHTDAWRDVDLPHDYVIEGEFTSEVEARHGALAHGKAWYIKKFHLPKEDEGKRIFIEFDGVYRNSQTMCNGHFVERHLSGYTSFGYDLTELCEFGEDNAIAVFVDASENELWSYEGGGIYRNVRLVKTAQVFVPQWGTYVTTGGADDPGKVNIEVTVRNMMYERVTAQVHNEIISPDGKVVARAEPVGLHIKAIESHTWKCNTRVDNPVLWSVDDPQLYTLKTTVLLDGKVMDVYETAFGIRYFNFDSETGFTLNGVPMKLKGVCCHQDHGGVGVAVPYGIQEWRVLRLKDMGTNAIRTSHNPADPAMLDVCDRLGMLVMDEIRMPGTGPELFGQAESVILRDRNHPSVIMWSIGNEEMNIQQAPVGIRIFKRLQHMAHTLDASRVTTYANNETWIKICDYQREMGHMVDVWGSNYRSGQRSEHYDEFHAKHPDWPMVGTETFGGAATRGLYEPDKSQLPVKLRERWIGHPDLWRDEKYKGFASAYGGTRTPWGYSIEETWQDCANRDFMSGTFIWTGFDYRGEVFPYNWPSVITRFGILDLCGFYKEIAHYLRAWWRPEDAHIFLMPHWNWQGREGEIIDVWCYANSAEVELFLNGESLGRKDMPENFRLEWQVPFEAGELKAVGYDATGNEVSSTVRRTTGAPAAVKLHPYGTSMQADADDVLVVDVSVVDKNGDVCPLADDTVTFNVTGPVEILGVGNGNPVSHEPVRNTNQRRVFHGWCQVILKATGEAGTATLSASGWQLDGAEVEINVA